MNFVRKETLRRSTETGIGADPLAIQESLSGRLDDQSESRPDAYETDYEVGQDNIDWMGLDIHNPVFFISAGVILTFCVAVLAMPEAASVVLRGARDWTIQSFDWFFVLVTNACFLFCLAIGVSPLGRIRLGGDDAKPEFSTLSWIAMLFSAGIGVGLVFYGAAEPMAYFTGWGGAPLGAEPASPEAERLAFAATLFHWSVVPWSVYSVMGMALAFFTFNKGLPLAVRSAFFPVLGDRIWGWPGHIIDLLAIAATLFGLATALGLGARQAASGIAFLFGFEAGLALQITIIAGVTLLAIFSVVRGLDKGVKLLSNINIGIALALLTFIFVAGPTLTIIDNLWRNAGAFFINAPALNAWMGRPDQKWFHDWTIFYWAWWVSWAPFVGMFIARVSRGRRIREFLLALLAVPFVISLVWFTAFGTTAIEQVKTNVGTLPGGIDDISLVLFQMLETMPLAHMASGVTIVLLITFFVTSSDSGSLVIDSITAGGKIHAPTPQRVFWASVEGLVAAVLLVGGGATALASLQAGAVTTGLPFALVLLVCCYSLYKGLRSELAA